MKAGATYNLIVKLPEITDEPSEQEIIDEIIFTIKCGSVMLSKVYPSDVSLVDDIYIIPLNQAETKQLVGNCQLEAQINYVNKAVQKSYIQSFTVSDTLATKDVEGVPDSVHNSELILKLIGSDVLVISIVPEVADEIIKNMNKLYLATKQAMEDTESYGEKTKSELQAKLQDALSSIDATTAGKLQDIANTALAQIDSINHTAIAQIESINSSAVAAGESQIKGINRVASSQIDAINNVANQQLRNINAAATHQIEMIENKTSIQIYNINNTALSQIDAINKTAQEQSQALNLQAREIYDNLGISPNTVTILTSAGNISSSDEYIIPITSNYIRLDSMVINGSEVEFNDTNYLRVKLSSNSDGTGLTTAFDITETGKNYSLKSYGSDYKYIQLKPYYSSTGLECIVKYTLLDYDIKAKIDDLEARVTALENKKEV
jgi:hypothetical protein